MAQLLTLVSVLAAIGAGIWLFLRTKRPPDSVDVRLGLDRSGPGSHLVWDVANLGVEPITVTKLVIHTRTGTSTVPLGIAHVLQTQEHTRVPTDVDWTLLAATSMGVCEANGREHVVSRSQLKAIQEQINTLIERRPYTPSAQDWLYGATNMAVGAVILGLGVFMLMWVIATG